ncbi:hypothetical protein PoB_001528500 [Plakobranchus ocellatus]|uniref:Uncharacterized protein n=1 Tax=Plakobranchus ocellatus TaxID=259542 RepID=A0AAV3Z2C1_9GAST|nr:hypothetical protein PoB_001528500 [Plakobranchus ocellatus]
MVTEELLGRARLCLLTLFYSPCLRATVRRHWREIEFCACRCSKEKSQGALIKQLNVSLLILVLFHGAAAATAQNDDVGGSARNVSAAAAAVDSAAGDSTTTAAYDAATVDGFTAVFRRFDHVSLTFSSDQAQNQKLHEQLLHALNDQLQLNLMQQAQLMKEAPSPHSPPSTSGNTPSSTSNATTSSSATTSVSGSAGSGSGRQRHQSANLQALLMEHQQIMQQIQLVQRQLAVASVLQHGPFAAMGHQSESSRLCSQSCLVLWSFLFGRAGF